MKCKFRKVCPDYKEDDEICKSNGAWSFDKKANCWIEQEEKQKEEDGYGIKLI